MRRAAKKDRNQTEIVQALRRVGATVQYLHMVGAGCPDLAVGYRGRTFFLEIKMPDEGLTVDQYRWHAIWCGQASVVHTPQEALKSIGAL